LGNLDADAAALVLAWLSPRELCRVSAVSRQIANVVGIVARAWRVSWERTGFSWPADVQPGSALGLLLFEYLHRCTEQLRREDSPELLLTIARVPMSARTDLLMQLEVDVLIPLRAWRPDLLGVLPSRQMMSVGLVERRRLVPTPPVALLRVRSSDSVSVGVGRVAAQPTLVPAAQPSPSADRGRDDSAGPSRSDAPASESRANAPEATPQLEPRPPRALSAAERYGYICSFYEQGGDMDAEEEQAEAHAQAPALRCGVVQRAAGQSSLYVVTEAQARRACRGALSASSFARTWEQLPHSSLEAARGGALWLVLNWAETELSENLPLACFTQQLRELLLSAPGWPSAGTALAQPCDGSPARPSAAKVGGGRGSGSGSRVRSGARSAD
jgi:hypothetical protein